MTIAFESEQNMTEDDAINLADFKFKLAFSAHNYLDSSVKYDDLSKVNWKIETVTFNGEMDVKTE
jgi:hypothetical protein